MLCTPAMHVHDDRLLCPQPELLRHRQVLQKRGWGTPLACDTSAVCCLAALLTGPLSVRGAPARPQASSPRAERGKTPANTGQQQRRQASWRQGLPPCSAATLRRAGASSAGAARAAACSRSAGAYGSHKPCRGGTAAERFGNQTAHWSRLRICTSGGRHPVRRIGRTRGLPQMAFPPGCMLCCMQPHQARTAHQVSSTDLPVHNHYSHRVHGRGMGCGEAQAGAQRVAPAGQQARRGRRLAARPVVAVAVVRAAARPQAQPRLVHAHHGFPPAAVQVPHRLGGDAGQYLAVPSRVGVPPRGRVIGAAHAWHRINQLQVATVGVGAVACAGSAAAWPRVLSASCLPLSIGVAAVEWHAGAQAGRGREGGALRRGRRWQTGKAAKGMSAA